jgi:hypothetical protein
MCDLNAEGEGGPTDGLVDQKRAGGTAEGEQLVDDTAHIIYSIESTKNK